MDVQLVSLQTALVGEGFPTGLTEEVEFQFCLLFTNVLFSQVNFPKRLLSMLPIAGWP